MLPMTSVVVYVASARSWLPIVAKWSIRLMQIPIRKIMPWQEDASQTAVGSNPAAGKGFFLSKSPLHEHIEVDFLLNIKLSSIKD